MEENMPEKNKTGENQNQILNVRELLKSTYSILSERHNPEMITLPGRALAEIANDSDGHRTRIGYMGYESVGLFQLDGKSWAIARGEKCGSYPAGLYDSDILAFEFELRRQIKGTRTRKKTDAQIQEGLEGAISQSDYFCNSLVYALADGNLVASKRGRFSMEMLHRLQPEIHRFIAQDADYDSEYLSLATLGPICKSSVKYKSEFAGFLADSVEAVLK